MWKSNLPTKPPQNGVPSNLLPYLSRTRILLQVPALTDQLKQNKQLMRRISRWLHPNKSKEVAINLYQTVFGDRLRYLLLRAWFLVVSSWDHNCNVTFQREHVNCSRIKSKSKPCLGPEPLYFK